MTAQQQQVDTCTNCQAPGYLNLDPRRQVDCWCHRATGSRYCDLSEQTVAQPLLAA